MMGIMSSLEIILILVVLVAGIVYSEVRISYNPGCDIPECNQSNLSVHLVHAYSNIQPRNESIHYIISTIGPSPPSLLLQTADINSTLDVNWGKLIRGENGGISMAGVKRSSLVVLDKLIEYNDTHDPATPDDPATPTLRSIHLTDIVWTVNLTQHSVTFVGQSDKLGQNGRLTIKFLPHDGDGEQGNSPHMFYNELSSTYDVIIDDVMPLLSGSRFAVSTIVSNLGNPPPPHTPPLVTSTTRWTINDEHAPTVFTTTELLWKQTNQSQASSYWQWRTVCYTSVDRNHKHSSDVKISMLVRANTTQKKEMLANPILRSYLRMDVLGGSLYWTSRVVFGSVGDGGYNATRYLYWSTLVGFGTPPSDRFSAMIISILVAGLGIPLLVLIAGGVYLGLRGKPQYERL